MYAKVMRVEEIWVETEEDTKGGATKALSRDPEVVRVCEVQDEKPDAAIVVLKSKKEKKDKKEV